MKARLHLQEHLLDGMAVLSASIERALRLMAAQVACLL